MSSEKTKYFNVYPESVRLGKEFECPDCGEHGYWQHHAQPEIRECEVCRKKVRLRAGTLFRDSKVPILTLRQRDERYMLNGVVELDGAHFGRQETGNQSEVLIAIESKDSIDEKSRPKSKAGFAKVLVARETQVEVQAFVDKAIAPGTLVNTDGGSALRDLKGVDADYQVTNQDGELIERWLPWVHRFISNAKTWLLGTHHGIDAKYLARYMAEYTYRFNRCHDPDSLFCENRGKLITQNAAW